MMLVTPKTTKRNEKLIQLRRNKLILTEDGTLHRMLQKDLQHELQKLYHIRITKSYISMIESGRRVPTLGIAQALADYFNTTVDDLFPKVDILDRFVKDDFEMKRQIV